MFQALACADFEMLVTSSVRQTQDTSSHPKAERGTNSDPPAQPTQRGITHPHIKGELTSYSNLLCQPKK